MKNKIFFFVIFLFVFLGITSTLLDTSLAQSCGSDLDCQISQIQKEIDALSPAQEKNKQDLAALNKQISDLKSKITQLSNQVNTLAKQISGREEDLAYTKEIFDQKAKGQYMFLRLYDPITPFLFSDTASQAFQEIGLRQRAADSDRKTMEDYAKELSKLNTDKETLEKSKVSLSSFQSQVAEKQKFLAGEVAKVDSYLSSLTSKQQQLVALKLGSLGLPLTLGAGALSCTDDRKLDPGFSPAFAFFTFGIPHYVGMNQYGAYGRAKFENQDYKTILKAYYANTTIECRDVPSTISVQNYGSLLFEDYIKGVVNKEMGADISEALKAQAVAARSYALNQPQPICTTQYCQVYSSARREAANSAVNATGADVCGAGKAEVLVSNGQIITAWYASTFGGYAHRSSVQLPNAGNTSYTREFVDSQGSVNSFSDLFQKAYDRESKCFYAAQGWRGQYGNSAWLKSSEVADIVNVILLARANPSTREHLCQTDKPANPNYGCNDTWSEQRVREELSKYRQPFTNIANVSVDANFSTGTTTNVNISGDAPSPSPQITGNEFKSWFNLRAPANIQIVGPLFNIEKR